MADPQARTQAYLDEHKIQEKLNELLLGVVVELPDDPFTWMADRLMEGESSAPPAATMPASAAQDPVVAQTAAAYASVMSVDGSAADAGIDAAGGADDSPSMRRSAIHVNGSSGNSTTTPSSNSLSFS